MMPVISIQPIPPQGPAAINMSEQPRLTRPPCLAASAFPRRPGVSWSTKPKGSCVAKHFYRYTHYYLKVCLHSKKTRSKQACESIGIIRGLQSSCSSFQNEFGVSLSRRYFTVYRKTFGPISNYTCIILHLYRL